MTTMSMNLSWTNHLCISVMKLDSLTLDTTEWQRDANGTNHFISEIVLQID